MIIEIAGRKFQVYVITAESLREVLPEGMRPLTREDIGRRYIVVNGSVQFLD